MGFVGMRIATFVAKERHHAVCIDNARNRQSSRQPYAVYAAHVSQRHAPCLSRAHGEKWRRRVHEQCENGCPQDKVRRLKTANHLPIVPRQLRGQAVSRPVSRCQFIGARVAWSP